MYYKLRKDRACSHASYYFMIVLAIESSCDETAAAVVRDGREVLSNIVASQVQDHAVFGGVVPEIASRKHLEASSGGP